MKKISLNLCVAVLSVTMATCAMAEAVLATPTDLGGLDMAIMLDGSDAVHSLGGDAHAALMAISGLTGRDWTVEEDDEGTHYVADGVVIGVSMDAAGVARIASIYVSRRDVRTVPGLRTGLGQNTVQQLLGDPSTAYTDQWIYNEGLSSLTVTFTGGEVTSFYLRGITLD